MALITTKDKLKEFSAISKHIEIGSVAPYIERAEREFLIPQIGQSTYDDLEHFFNSTGSPSTDAEILKRVQSSITNFALFLGFDMFAVHFSEAGIQRVESTERKSAYQYQEINLKNNLLETGFETLGAALEYLEKYKNTYTVWPADVAAHNRFKKRVIHTPAQFQEYFDIKNSWSTFFRLRSTITQVEDLFLEPVLGSTFLEEIKEQIKADTTTNAVLIELIRKATVFLAISEAAHSKIIQFGKDGAFEVRRAGSSITKHEPAVDKKLAEFVRKQRSAGELYLKRLVEHLNKEASAIKYATYFGSEQYQDPTSADYSHETWKNESTNQSVIF